MFFLSFSGSFSEPFRICPLDFSRLSASASENYLHCLSLLHRHDFFFLKGIVIFYKQIYLKQTLDSKQHVRIPVAL